MNKPLLLGILMLLCSLPINAAKSHYIPTEWQTYSSKDTLLYKETDTSNKYTWSESRSRETDNVIVYWDKYYGSTAPDELDSSSSYYVDIDDLLEKAEAFYQLECYTLGFVDPETSNVSKYKIMILLNYTTGWICYGGGYDYKCPALWLSPSTCKPVGSAVAHEVGHSFHYMCYGEDSNYGSNSSIQTGFHSAVGNGQCIWETTANWQALQSYPDEIMTESYHYAIFPYTHNYAFSHEWHRYQAYMFLCYLVDYYDDITIVSQVWNQRETSVVDFNQALMDLKGLSVSELYKLHFDFAMHASTWDISACEGYADGYIGNFTTNLVALDDAKYQVAYSSVPQGTGFNIIELNVPLAGTTVTTDFTALDPGCSLADDDPKQYFNGSSVYTDYSGTTYNSMTTAQKSYRGFRVGYVVLKSDGSREYFDDETIHCTGTGEVTESISCTVPDDAERMWLVIAPALSSYIQHEWDEDITDDDQWPYQIEIENTNLAGVPTLDGRDIDDVTFTYDVNLVVASDYSSATIKLGGKELTALCNAFQLTMSDIYSKVTSYSSSQSNNTVMFYPAYSDGTLQASGSTANGYGHWFNSSGAVTSWGSSSVAFSECTISSSGMTFNVGQYPSANSAGDRYTIAQAWNYIDSNGSTATATFVFNINFISSGSNSATLTDIDYIYPYILLNELSIAAPSKAKAKTVGFNRLFNAGWNSLCLPISVTATEIGATKVVEFTGTELIGGASYNALFTTVTGTLEANKPYMVYVENPNTDILTFSDKTIEPEKTLVSEDAANGAYTFVGTYKYFDNSCNQSPIVAGDYTVTATGLKAAKGGNRLRAFRAYLRQEDSANGVNIMDYMIDGDELTGVESISFGNAIKQDVYDLQGRKLQDCGRGIYIINGEKRIRK